MGMFLTRTTLFKCIVLLSIVTSTSQTDGQCKCFRPFVYFGRNCYYFANKRQYFHEAEEVCNGFSYHNPPGPSHLTSVHTEDENSFIYEKARQLWGTTSYWLGATDDNLDGNFQWIDGSPMNFTSFASGQPSGNQRCLQQWASEGWDDDFCSSYQKLFVCKKPAKTASCFKH